MLSRIERAIANEYRRISCYNCVANQVKEEGDWHWKCIQDRENLDYELTYLISLLSTKQDALKYEKKGFPPSLKMEQLDDQL